jgi:hypothetical protein
MVARPQEPVAVAELRSRQITAAPRCRELRVRAKGARGKFKSMEDSS